ncbi:UBX domain-containing protein 10-like [Parasteatoda tepidariorum]|uniref:UBX domain-containing protein 10-like n=1 Tax=Parasteatoda tepidariorum TaxID=114398 RepID=UPI0039BD31F3
MHSAKLSTRRSRWRRSSDFSKHEDIDRSESSLSSLSRPSTQESKRSSCSRLSTDSGAGSLDDFNSRRSSTPDFWRGSVSRRHTAPIKKSPGEELEILERPNTVHAWDSCLPKCSLSRYTPLPAIGAQKELLQKKIPEERPFPVRRQCFMGPLDIDNEEESLENDINENIPSYTSDVDNSTQPPLFSLTLESDSDSDFEEDSDNPQQYISEDEDFDLKPKKPLIRSATFTIEKERPDVRGPYVTVAVRLPDGTRVAERFDCKDMLGSVGKFALDKIDGLCPQRYSLVTTDVPKRIFKDMTITLKDAGIADKTLLCLQSLDDSDSD